MRNDCSSEIIGGAGILVKGEMKMVSVQENLISRRSIYRFENTPVQRDCLERAFEAARHAPCHKQTHPWRFYVLGKQARARIVDVVENLSREKSMRLGEIDVEKMVEKARSKILAPPRLIAVTTVRTIGDSVRDEEDYAATVCALHNMVLSLWDQGIGCQWSTGSITRDPAVYSMLEVQESEQRVIGFLKVGYPAVIPEREKKAMDGIRFYLD
tara:strand:+ start:1309 stop:1947 length:639 start_codon:yes stop_codon:yes gene_type:complete